MIGVLRRTKKLYIFWDSFIGIYKNALGEEKTFLCSGLFA